MGARSGLADVVTDLGRELGLRARVHALDLDTGAEVGVSADDPVVAASVFKVPVLVEAVRQADLGELDPRAPVRVAADHVRVAGGSGLSAVLDEVTMSVRDLWWSMMSVSDNRATDLVMEMTGIERVNALMERLDLPGTRLVADCRGLFAQLEQDTGLDPDDPELVVPGPETVAAMRACRPLDPLHTNRTTARESTTLLRRLWNDDGLPPAVCAEVRRIMGLQVWVHRLSSGFPEPGVRMSGKTGTLWFVRNEVGVVERPDGTRYAVAVFCTLPGPQARQPAADAAIGALGRAAVDDLQP